MGSTTSKPNPQPRLYFAYGSNLSLAQMDSRCPTSTYHSFGVLHNYTWIIGPRGYANIIPSPSGPSSSPNPSTSTTPPPLNNNNNNNLVYGMLYTLLPADESALDRAEGVPHSYVKLTLPIQLLSPDSGTVEALVYVDVARKGTGKCREEYVGRMNRGIRDAVRKGMPLSYVRDVMQKWVREEEVPDDGEVEDPFHPKRMGDGSS